MSRGATLKSAAASLSAGYQLPAAGRPGMALISQTEDSKMTHESTNGSSRGSYRVSRRTAMNMLVSTAAVATAMPVATAARPAAPHPDAELLALADQYIAAQKEADRLYLVADRLNRPCGPLPEALLWREADTELGLPEPIFNERKGEPLAWRCGVAALRREKWMRATRLEDGDKLTISSWYEIPSPEARARADEIIAAFDAWLETGKPLRGYKSAIRARDRADRIADRINHEVAQTPARTMEGLRAKVRCAVAADSVESMDDLDIGSIAASIFRDLIDSAEAA